MNAVANCSNCFRPLTEQDDAWRKFASGNVPQSELCFDCRGRDAFRVSRPEAEQMRLCLQCFYTAGKRVPSTHIATADNRMQWFECSNHEPTDNPGGFTRVRLQPLNEWLREQGLEDTSELGTQWAPVCNICNNDLARFVATGQDGIRWYTCGNHGARKNLVTLAEWMREHGPLDETGKLPPRKGQDAN